MTRIAHVATVDLTVRHLLLPQLRYLVEQGYDVSAIAAPGPWVSEIEAVGVSFVPWRNATRSWDPARDSIAFFELIGILRRGRFDLVHTHNPKPGVLGRIAARAAGVPRLVNTVHGFYATSDDPLARKAPVLALEWLAARFSDLELYQSGEDLSWARRIGLAPARKQRALGNGTDLRVFDPSAVSDARVDEIRGELGGGARLLVGTIGRLVAEKGYAELFEAARIVRSRAPYVRFVVLGGAEPGKADALDGKALHRAGRDVTFAGWRSDVRDVLAAIDIFVLPSWREGVPRSAIEAAAMGRPLVLTDIRGCREVVTAPEEGILVPARDPRRLADAILGLIDDEPRRRKLGDAARATAVARFDERSVFRRVDAAYRELGVRPRGESAVSLRPARPHDAKAIAELHARSLPEAFLPSLGQRFMRHLYRGLMNDPRADVVVAESDHGIVGFAAGVRSVGAFYRSFLIRRGVIAAVLALPHTLQPGVAARAMETVRYPSGTDDLPRAELLAICVGEGARGSGTGRRLAARVLDDLAAIGGNRVKVVVSNENDAAIRFYESLGFTHVADVAVHRGVPSRVMVVSWRSSLVPSSVAS